MLLAAAVVVLGASAAAATLLSQSQSSGRACVDLVVPAYFSSGYWAQASATRPPPADMILDLPNGQGAGAAPDPGFQALVRKAQSAGITILGYSTTIDGGRPVAEIEADAQHYRQWYGVDRIFLDQVSGQQAQFGYYQQVAGYIHKVDGADSVWLNAGVYPDQDYMSIGDVVQVFEGSYAQFLTARVPGWATGYPASRFADTVYATPATSLSAAISTAESRHVMNVYVTDDVPPGQYTALPSNWSRESSYGCGAGGS